MAWQSALVQASQTVCAIDEVHSATRQSGCRACRQAASMMQAAEQASLDFIELPGAAMH